MITRIRLENFMSHASSEIHFTNGFNAIIGENGSGKTSILIAISLVLFGHKQYNMGYLVRNGATVADVELDFRSRLDKNIYTVTCRISKTASYAIMQGSKKLASGQKDTTQFIARHLLMSSDTSLAALARDAIMVPQGEMVSPFIKTDTERKAIFDRVLGVSEYEEAFKALSPTVTHVNNLLADQRQSSARLEGNADRADYLALDLSRAETDLSSIATGPLRQAVADVEVEIDQEKHRLASATLLIDKKAEESRKAQEVRQSIAVSESALERMRRDMIDLEAAKVLVTSSLNLEEDANKLSSDILLARQEKDTELGRLRARWSDLNDRKTALEEVDGALCPVCGEPLSEEKASLLKSDVMGEMDEVVDAANVIKTSTEINDMEFRLADLSNRMYSLNRAKETIAKFSSLETEILEKEKELSFLSGNLSMIETTISDLELEIKTIGADQDNLNAMQSSLANNKAILARAEARKEALEGDVARIKRELSEASEAKKKLAISRTEEVRLSGLADKLSTIRQAIRQAGPFVAEKVVNVISNEASLIFSAMMSNHESSTLKWTSGYGIETTASGITLDIRDAPVNGGKRQLAAIAVRLAILKVIGGIGFIALDEPTANLDDSAMAMLAESISRIGGMFEQILVISHDETFQGLTDNPINLKQVNGITEVV